MMLLHRARDISASPTRRVDNYHNYKYEHQLLNIHISIEVICFINYISSSIAQNLVFIETNQKIIQVAGLSVMKFDLFL